MSHSGIVESYYVGRYAVEISTDGTTWTAVSNASVKLDDVELNRPSGEAYVGGSSDWATITVGKREPVEITLTFLYNEDAAAAVTTVLSQFETSSALLGVRWAPRGLVGGARAFSTSNDGANTHRGVITNVTLATIDPSDANPYVAMVTVRTPTLRRYTIAASNPTDLSPA